jgi:putative transposase
VSRYIDEHRGRFGVEPICRVLGVSASAYYQRATGQRSERVTPALDAATVLIAGRVWDARSSRERTQGAGRTQRDVGACVTRCGGPGRARADFVRR